MQNAADSTQKSLHKRHRLSKACYMGPNAYFLTICSNARKRVFQNSRLVNLLQEELRIACIAHGFGVYAYCFMPDHLHLQIVGLAKDSDLQALIRAFKGCSTAKARAMGIQKLWQQGFYDHVIRRSEAHGAVAWYIFANPVRAGLAKNIGDWPFSGSWMFDWGKIATPTKEFVPPWKAAK